MKYGEFVALLRMLVVVICAAIVVSACALPDPANGPAFSQPMQTKNDLERAQAHFARGEFGLAEKNFRVSVESDSQNPEAWLGLAASYDQLGRFDLADRSYRRASQLTGETAVLLNNKGYSYMLRGDLGRARYFLKRAARMDPGDAQISRNIEDLNARLEKAGKRPVLL